MDYYDDDFVSGGSKNIWYFLINLILSIIITLCGSIYNEIIILFFYEIGSGIFSLFTADISKNQFMAVVILR